MAMPEFSGKFYRTNGAYVDEAMGADGMSHLEYCSYNEEGDLMFYVEFPRDESPESISEYFLDCAEDMMDDPPNDMAPEALEQFIENLIEESKRVPGLNRKK